MASRDKSGASAPQFLHPTAGPSTADFSIVAVRWRSTSSAADKRALLDKLGLVLHTLEGRKPQIAVNQTDGLSWVRAPNGEPIADAVIDQLEHSELVEWVMPAMRPQSDTAARQQPRAEPAPPVTPMYTINPSRFYVRDAVMERAGGPASLAAGLSADARHSRLRGYVTVNVDTPSYAGGRTAMHMALNLPRGAAAASNAPSAADVKFETIPMLSPTAEVRDRPLAHVGHDRPARVERAPTCRPPQTEHTPDDPMFATQWGLQRVGAQRGWQIARGVPAVTVAVIDEGVQLDHPDLLLHPQSLNASDDTPDGSPTGNHGTACAGIIGARLDNGAGVAGLAGGCRIMAIATETWADVDIAEGLYFAADNGARVVSMSFGVYASWNYWDFDLIRDALQYAHDRGLVLIAAAGNENGPVARFPGSDGRTLCVGGSNRSDERKRIGDASSEAWWGASYGPDVDVVAPCLEMPTTDRLGNDGYSANDYYDRFNGTSSATPVVAGLAALLLSLRPTLSNVEVRSLIESSCDKISPALYTYQNVPAKPSGTWNDEVGYGRINVERALLAACSEADCACEAECSGCGDVCRDPTPEECRGPEPVPWLAHDRCMYFYESRVFDGSGDRAGAQRLRLRVTYQHCLRLIGRQQGPLLYTTTLLPNEQVRLYEHDRYRRTKAASARMSVHTSFRQTLSALSQSRRATSASAYAESITETRNQTDASVSVGGGLAGFLGLPSGKVDSSSEVETTVASGASVRTVTEQFTQFAVTASQSVEAERSLTVSSFEEQEHVSTTQRTLRNDNDCYAVTYYVRRVNEVYEIHSRIEAIEWRLGDGGAWRSIEDQQGLPDVLRKLLDDLMRQVLRHGQSHREPRQITLPTDGTVYEAEIAHCASCDPFEVTRHKMQIEQMRLQTRRACLENELLELEVARRKALAMSTQAVELQVGAWPLLANAHANGHSNGHANGNGHAQALGMGSPLSLPSADAASSGGLAVMTPAALPAPN